MNKENNQKILGYGNNRKYTENYLFVKQVQGKLKSNCFHVGFLQSGGNVHVHVQESLHGTPLFGLFNLQLRQKIDKPFKRSLITIDPEKVDLKLERKRFKYFD